MSLGCHIANSRPVWTTKQDPVSKKKKERKEARKGKKERKKVHL
jgi:hypothetical protein